MMSRGQKTLIFLGAVLAFSAALAAGAILFWMDGQPWPALFWAVVWGLAVAATIWGLIGFRRESDPAIVGEGGHEIVHPPRSPLPPEADRDNPWPFEWLAPALAEAFADTPYVVRSNGRSVLVHADLVDARWQHVATTHKLQHTFVARFTPTGRRGVVRRNDESRHLEAQAGVTRLGAQLAVKSGRQWSFTRRVEYGLGLDGFKKRVDYSFSTAEINEPVSIIMKRSGWRETLDGEAKGALAMACLGGSALVLVPLGLGINALVS